MPLPLFLPCAAASRRCWPTKSARCCRSAARQARARRRRARRRPARGDGAQPREPARAARAGRGRRRAATAARTTSTTWRARVDWTDWVTPRAHARVDITAQRSPLRSLNFAALRIKDARLRRAARRDRRATERRHAASPTCRWCCTSAPSAPALYVDTSGESLFKRGWREDKGDAPLKETLAAAMLAAAGWRGTPTRAARCTTRAAARGRSPSRRRRSPAASRPGCSAASPSSGCCRSPTPAMRADWQRLK